MHFGASWHQFTHLQTGNAKENDGRGGASRGSIEFQNIPRFNWSEEETSSG